MAGELRTLRDAIRARATERAAVEKERESLEKDRAAWEQVSASLCDAVRRDFAEQREYWAKYEDTPVSKASDAVYEGFLHSYGQTLGLKSYGACVDLLVAYYYDEAARGTTDEK